LIATGLFGGWLLGGGMVAGLQFSKNMTHTLVAFSIALLGFMIPPIYQGSFPDPNRTEFAASWHVMAGVFGSVILVFSAYSRRLRVKRQ
jgi:hypothetical protein